MYSHTAYRNITRSCYLCNAFLPDSFFGVSKSLFEVVQVRIIGGWRGYDLQQTGVELCREPNDRNGLDLDET